MQHNPEVVIDPGATAQAALPQIAGNGASPPPKDAYIERELTSLGVPFWRDDEGTLITVLEHPDTNNTLGCWFLAEGEKGKSLQVLCTSVQTLPLSHVPKALRLLNTFHMESRIGRAFLHIDEEQAQARIYYDSRIDRTDGVLHAVLRIFLRSSLASAITLLKLTEKEKLYLPRPKRSRNNNLHKGGAAQP